MLQLKLGEIECFPFLDRPLDRQISDGFSLLAELNAIDGRRQLTRMGKQMSGFPLDVRFSRMLVAMVEFD